jgi:hypothetical protein
MPTQRRGEEIRARILEAATEAFAGTAATPPVWPRSVAVQM